MGLLADEPTLVLFLMLRHSWRDGNKVGFRLAFSDILKLALCPIADLMSEWFSRFPSWTSRATWWLVAGQMWPTGRTLCTIGLSHTCKKRLSQV